MAGKHGEASQKIRAAHLFRVPDIVCGCHPHGCVPHKRFVHAENELRRNLVQVAAPCHAQVHLVHQTLIVLWQLLCCACRTPT